MKDQVSESQSPPEREAMTDQPSAWEMLEQVGTLFRILRQSSRTLERGYQLDITAEEYRKVHEAYNALLFRLAAQSASAPERTVVAWRIRLPDGSCTSWFDGKPPNYHGPYEIAYAAPTFTDKQGREALAEGCRSSVSPCSHQKASPYTLCDICQPALKTVTIVIPSGYQDAAEFLKDCQFERADASVAIPAARPQADGVREALHAFNEWADLGSNATQWLKNIRDGISTPIEALAEMEANYTRVLTLARAACKALSPQPLTLNPAMVEEKK